MGITMKNPHYFLAEDLLAPFVNRTDGSRLNMFVSQTGQLLTLQNGEVPKVFSNFENQIGEHSKGMGYVKANDDLTLVKEIKINENKIHYFFSTEEKRLECYTFKSSSRLTEEYGYSNINKINGKKTFKKNDVLIHNTMYDSDLNLKYGVNLLTTFLTCRGLTFEDSIILSESASKKKLSHVSVAEACINLNNNDVLLDIHNGKPFPDIGEKFENILCVRRRLNYNTALVDFKESTTILPSDTPFYFEGKIENIEVYSNLDEDSLNLPQNKVIKELVCKSRNDWSEIKTFIEEKVKEGYSLSDNAGYLLKKSREYLSGLKFTKDKSEFEGTLIEFTISKENPAYPGSKIANRFGGKGIIGKILPDNEMPQTEDGRIPDVILNPLGIWGRQNPSQLFEHELNYIADELIRTEKDNVALFKKLVRFLEILEGDDTEFGVMRQASFIKENVKSRKNIDSFISDVRENGLLIHQPPFFGNCKDDTLFYIYEEFNIQKTKFKNIQNKLIIAPMYFIKLRHEASGKLSSRSAAQVSILDVPFKSNERYKKGTAPINDSPVRFGEQEMFNMLLLANEKEGSQGVMEFLRHYSSNSVERRGMLKALIKNDIKNIVSFDILEEDESKNVVTNAAQVIRSFFAGLGINIDKEQSEEIAMM